MFDPRALFFFLLISGLFILGGFWQPHDINIVNISLRHTPSTITHWLGTDHLGRDMLSLIMAAGWRTYCVILLVAGIGFSVGTLLGASAALAPKPIEAAILRCCEFFIMVPTLIVALTIAAIFGLSPLTAGVALGVSAIGPHALFAHSIAKRVLVQPFILAAHSLGADKVSIILRHLLPNIIPSIFVHTANQAGFAVVSYASLAFIGLGNNSATPDWGSMLFEYRIFIFDNPTLILWPGLAIALTIIILNSAFKTKRLPLTL